MPFTERLGHLQRAAGLLPYLFSRSCCSAPSTSGTLLPCLALTRRHAGQPQRVVGARKDCGGAAPPEGILAGEARACVLCGGVCRYLHTCFALVLLRLFRSGRTRLGLTVSTVHAAGHVFHRLGPLCTSAGLVVDALLPPRPLMLSFCQAEGASRDLLLLDIALDGYFRLLVERMDKGAMQGEVLRPAL